MIRIVDDQTPAYVPTVSAEEADRLRRWHENAYQTGLVEGAAARTFDYLGLTVVVPPHVMPVTPVSHLLGEAVLAAAGADDRVLDMGTGSGINAILAATKGAMVVAVDINPYAIEAARANAEHNGVAGRVDVRRSNVFSDVDGQFDLIVFDPPFRWFAPRDIYEAASTDEGYRAMTTFFRQARAHLTPRGRMLIFFGTSGDLGHLKRLMREAGFTTEVVAQDGFVKDGARVDYYTFLVTPDPGEADGGPAAV
jgi:release factor glutamine methyltransferase